MRPSSNVPDTRTPGGCGHHWQVAPAPSTNTYPARCRRCGAQRAFPVLDNPPDFNGVTLIHEDGDAPRSEARRHAALGAAPGRTRTKRRSRSRPSRRTSHAPGPPPRRIPPAAGARRRARRARLAAGAARDPPPVDASVAARRDGRLPVCRGDNVTRQRDGREQMFSPSRGRRPANRLPGARRIGGGSDIRIHGQTRRPTPPASAAVGQRNRPVRAWTAWSSMVFITEASSRSSAESQSQLGMRRSSSTAVTPSPGRARSCHSGGDWEIPDLGSAA